MPHSPRSRTLRWLLLLATSLPACQGAVSGGATSDDAPSATRHDAAAPPDPGAPPQSLPPADAAPPTAGRADAAPVTDARPGDATPTDALPVLDPTVLRAHESNIVFDDAKLSTWTLTIDPADLQKLNDTAFMKVPVPATLKVDDEEVGKIGVRYKGQYSLNVFCKKDGKLSCTKVSLKLDFSEFEPDKRFHGLKHIFLHSHNEDATRLHERLAYQLFREAGVPAPRSVHAKVIINGAYKGVYGLTETIDGKFTDYWFSKDKNGNLYKEAWPTSTDPKFYTDRQKTNEGEQAPARVLTLAAALKAAKREQLPALIDSWMGLEELTRITVVDRAISDWDDFLSFYCGNATGSCANHNFFIYESATQDRVHLLPWDMDKAFPLYPAQDALGLWNDPNPKCDANIFAAGTFWLRHPGCDPVIRGLADGAKARYVAFIDEFLAGPYDLARMQAELDRWTNQISDAVMKEIGATNYGGWRYNVDAFKNDLSLLREKILTMRDNHPPYAFTLAVDANNDFEGLTPFGAATGVTTGSSTHSTVDRTINHDKPLAGATDLKVAFSLQNAADDATGAFAQRSYIRLVLRSPMVDLSKLAQLQLKLKSDSPRAVRIEIGSGKYKTTTGRPIRFGWELTATPQGGTVTLDPAQLALPANAPATGDDLKEVLTNATLIYVVALPNKLGTDGQMPKGAVETGWLQVDDVLVKLAK